MVEIYLITSPSGKRYVGQANTVCYKGKPRGANKRWREHVAQGKSFLLSAAIKKYGADAFVRELLLTCPEKDADKMEDLAIVMYNTLTPGGYNLRRGGRGGTMSDESRRRCKMAAKMRAVETKLAEAMRKRRTGAKADSATRRRMSEAAIKRGCLKNITSEASRAKAKATLTGQPRQRKGEVLPIYVYAVPNGFEARVPRKGRKSFTRSTLTLEEKKQLAIAASTTLQQL